MKNITTDSVRFLRDWVLLAVKGNSTAQSVGRGVGAVVVVVVALSVTDRLGVVVYGQGARPPDGGVPMAWQPQVGWLITLGVVVVWFAVAFGMTWARFGLLRIETTDHADSLMRRWTVRVLNDGSADVKAAAVINRVVPEINPPWLFDLPWAENGEKESVIPAGDARTLVVLRMGGPSHVTIADKRGEQYELSILAPVGLVKRWVQVSVRGIDPKSAAKTAWLSVAWVGDGYRNAVVKFENPPDAAGGSASGIGQSLSRKLSRALDGTPRVSRAVRRAVKHVCNAMRNRGLHRRPRSSTPRQGT